MLENVSLQSYNSMAVPAIARYLQRVHSLDDLINCVNFAQHHAIDILPLGEGSNTLFEQDVSGLVVVNQIRGIEQLETSSDNTLVRVGAGENWHHFVEYSLQQGWYGLENLALIPGSVGAAPIQNIGAYGVEVNQFVESVKALEIATGEFIELSNEECQFAYRDSCFKHELTGKVIIVSVDFRLDKKPKPVLNYPSLTDLQQIAKVTPQHVFNRVCAIRSGKLPHPNDIPNAGSFFKNPIVKQAQLDSLLAQYPELVFFPLSKEQSKEDQNHYKLAAAWLIETAGWKGITEHGVGVHQQQALVIINPDKQRGNKVMNFARKIQRDILQKFSIALEIEPIVIGKA